MPKIDRGASPTAGSVAVGSSPERVGQLQDGVACFAKRQKKLKKEGRCQYGAGSLHWAPGSPDPSTFSSS